MYETIRWVYSYLRNNIHLPRAVAQTPLVVWPTVRSGVFRVSELFAGIHPAHIGVVLLFGLVACFLYIKIKYPFWNNEPVFHIYDFWRKWYHSPFLVYKNPVKTKYYSNQCSVETFSWGDLADPYIPEIRTKQLLSKTAEIQIPHHFVGIVANLLQDHYIPSDRIIYNLEERDLASHFHSQSQPEYISVFHSVVWSNGSNGSDVSERSEIPNQEEGAAPSAPVLEKRVLGCITSRTIHIYLFTNHGEKHHQTAYYQDFRCLHRKHTKHMRVLFDTHEYNIRVLNPETQITLFKQETELCEGVVPFLPFYTYTYCIGKLERVRVSTQYTLSRITKTNTQSLHQFWGELTGGGGGAPADAIQRLFSTIVIPELSSILGRINSRNLWAFALTREDHVYAMYFITNAHTNYEEMDDAHGNGGNTLHLVASVCNTDDVLLFYKGFLLVIREILKESPHFKMINIDAIGHNELVRSQWNKSHSPTIQTPAAYYLYNWIVPHSPVDVGRCFILV